MNCRYEKGDPRRHPLDAGVLLRSLPCDRAGRRAVNDGRRAESNAHAKSKTPTGKWLKGRPLGAAQDPENLTDRQRLALAAVQQTKRLYRAYLLKEQVRALYHLDDPATAPESCWPGQRARSYARSDPGASRASRDASPRGASGAGMCGAAGARKAPENRPAPALGAFREVVR